MKEDLESPLPIIIIKEWGCFAMEIMGPRCFLAFSRKAGLNRKEAPAAFPRKRGLTLQKASCGGKPAQQDGG